MGEARKQATDGHNRPRVGTVTGHSDNTPMVELYPFRYFDALRKRWIEARYVATKEDIAASHERWEITGPGEVREDRDGRRRGAT